MLLTELYKLSQREDVELPITGYNQVSIRWFVTIDSNGNLIGTEFQDQGQDAEKREVPYKEKTNKIVPVLLVGNGEYVLGIPKKEGDLKVAKRHESFKQLVKRCADATQEASINAVVKFLETWNPEIDKAKLPEEFDPNHNITFEVRFPDNKTVIPADVREGLPEIQEFWAKDLADDGKTKPILTCLVTGKEIEVEERLPVKIKGLPNGQKSGTALVSANKPPFKSYGLAYCLTSPICREAGEGFAKALNYLISTKDSRFFLNKSIVYVFWTRDPIEDDGWGSDEDQPLTIKEHLLSIFSTERSYGIDENRFYAIGLSASGGRAVVRDWIDITLSERSLNLLRWFEGQEIVNEYGQYIERPYLSIRHLAQSLVRDPKEEEKAVNRMMPRLVRTALKGESLSLDILSQLVRRNRAERNVTRQRAALMKLVLATQENYQDAMKDMQCLTTNPQFEQESDRAAYHCGRLLAQLERIQETALGRDLNANIIDRFYGAASTTPGKVFGGLIKDAQAHLSRIRKDKRNAYEALQQKLEEILCNISPETDKLPNNLTMQQQSIFALGYYHQRAQNRHDAKAAKEAKEAKKSAEA